METEIGEDLEMNGSDKGRMWSLDQKIDQPIEDTEAGHIRGMDVKKVSQKIKIMVVVPL